VVAAGASAQALDRPEEPGRARARGWGLAQGPARAPATGRARPEAAGRQEAWEADPRLSGARGQDPVAGPAPSGGTAGTDRPEGSRPAAARAPVPAPAWARGPAQDLAWVRGRGRGRAQDPAQALGRAGLEWEPDLDWEPRAARASDEGQGVRARSDRTRVATARVAGPQTRTTANSTVEAGRWPTRSQCLPGRSSDDAERRTSASNFARHVRGGPLPSGDDHARGASARRAAVDRREPCESVSATFRRSGRFPIPGWSGRPRPMPRSARAQPASARFLPGGRQQSAGLGVERLRYGL